MTAKRVMKVANSSSLSSGELSRYARHLSLPEFGIEGQKRLKAASVLVVGAGGLGSPALLYLAAAGVGRIGIIDNDKVEESNLQRQILFRASDLGKEKATVAAQVLKELNPFVEVEPFSVRLSVENARDIIKSFDLVLDGSDNFATRFLVNDACVELGKPFVSGAIFKFSGQLSIFNGDLGHGKRGATYRCVFPEAPPLESMPNCSEAGVLGVVPGIIGTLQASEAIKYIVGLGESLVGRMLVLDLLSMNFRFVRVERNEEIARATRVLASADYLKLISCQTKGENVGKITELSPKDLKSWQESKRDFFLLDVRESFEKEIADIGGELISVKALAQNLDKIPKDKTIVVYCRSGGRSFNACQELQRHGYSDLYNLSGGILAWADEVDGAIKKY